MDATPSIPTIPPDLEELLEWRHPGFLGGMAERHSELAYTVLILDLDGHGYQWRCHQSLDGRWTLSPL